MLRFTRRTALLAPLPFALAARQIRAWGSKQTSKGSLVLAGGGKPYEDSVLDEFWRLSGGKEARIVVVPTAHTEMDHAETRTRRTELVSAPWQKRGVKSITLRHTLQREEANNEEFAAALREATGVWIGGGDQSRLLDSYRDTKFHHELQNLFNRDGVIGGSSAGTAVMSELAILADSEGVVKTAPGFNLWPGVVVDQHFLKRQRQARLQRVVREQKKLLGVGIDEYTAAVVREGTLRVVGKSSVTLYAQLAEHAELRTRTLKPGDSVQLADWYAT